MTKAAKLRALLNRPGLAAAAGYPWVRAAVPRIPYSPPEIVETLPQIDRLQGKP